MPDIILMLSYLSYTDKINKIINISNNPIVSVEAICKKSGCRIEVHVYDYKDDNSINRDYTIAKSVVIEPTHGNWQHLKEQTQLLFLALKRHFESYMNDTPIIKNEY